MIPTPRRSRTALTIAVALFALGGSLVPSLPEAQVLGRIVGGAVGGSVVGLGTAIGSDRRFVILRPRLAIAEEQRAGAVTQLAFDRDRKFLFAVLADGGSRWWDLERGLERGATRGEGIGAGLMRGGGRWLEMLSVRADGSSELRRLDGTSESLSGPIPGFDPAARPAIAENGAMAFRARDGSWWANTYDGERMALPDAALEALPTISSDGYRIAYRTDNGRALSVVRLFDRRLEQAGRLTGCGDSVPITATLFSPWGDRVLLGDARGNICLWDVSGMDGPRSMFSVDTALDGPVRTLAMDRDGKLAAAGDGRATVELWPMSGRIERRASVTLQTDAAGALALDGERGWLMAGGANGRIAVHDFEIPDDDLRSRPVAQLLSTSGGWSVLDRNGRFDGSQNGIDALSWTGTAQLGGAEHALPVDSFSESHHEPGLLAKLDDPGPVRLNENARDLSSGYFRPPKVTVDASEPDSAGMLTATVRVERGYRTRYLTGIRLYRNGKLVLDGEGGSATLEARIAAIPGDNEIRAVALGPEGVEGPPATVRVTGRGKPLPSQLIVLAIGIEEYGRGGWYLRFPREDTEKMVSVLRNRGARLRAQHGRRAFEGVRAETLLDKSAGKDAIEALLSNAPSEANDVLIVYFSGHGYALREEDGWDWYLLPYSPEWRYLQEATLAETIREHGLSARELLTLLTGTAAQRVFLVLDSCQSGAVIGAFEGDEAPNPQPGDDAATQKVLRQIARIGGLHVLAASRAHEDARELQAEPHGALTWLVLEGIGGKADADRDKNVSVREIIDYATAEMPNLADRLSQEPISQKPVGYSRGADFAIAGL